MKTMKFVRDIIKNPTIAFQALGTVAGALLLNLLQQYDIACKNDINGENSFITNYDNLPEFLGMEIECLEEAFYTLDRLELVGVFALPEEASKNWVAINLEEIRDFFKEFKREQKISMQAELLKCSTVKSIGNSCESTKKLRAFIKKHYDKEILTIVYAYCNSVIIDYEECTRQSFTKIPKL